MDLLSHDAQYSTEEYVNHVGWGHSSLAHALAFATLAKVKHFVPFHHDPAHTDEDLDRLTATAVAAVQPAFGLTPGVEGAVLTLGTPAGLNRGKGTLQGVEFSSGLQEYASL
ncbi:MAG TPA: hypothetical protein VKK81_03170 [Candidatus Binatia bacterium]|nr:hypothetical protein [Candidatus Binatia bacterium]